MALTRELITANAELSALTDAQIQAITTLSQNDESAVIGARIGEIYRNMDATIASATGIQRNGDEKTYDYLARATQGIAEKAKQVDTLQTQITTLTDEKTRLEKVIQEGTGDAETKKALEQAKKDLQSVRKQFTDLKAEFDTAKANHANELFGIKIDNELTKATADIQFKTEIPKSATDVILSNALCKIKGMTPEFIDDGKGGQILAFKDNNGAIMRNPDNMLNPYTAAELVTKELKAMGVLAEGKPTGTGTIPPQGGGGSGTIDISGCRTRNEANDVISKALLAQGKTIGSAEYDQAMTQAWKDNNVMSLPLN